VNENDQTAKLKVLAPTLSGEMATTGSSVVIKETWLTADALSAATAEGTYTFTLSTAQGSPEATNTLTFKSTLTDATTVVNVKLKAAN